MFTTQRCTHVHHSEVYACRYSFDSMYAIKLHEQLLLTVKHVKHSSSRCRAHVGQRSTLATQMFDSAILYGGLGRHEAAYTFPLSLLGAKQGGESDASGHHGGHHSDYYENDDGFIDDTEVHEFFGGDWHKPKHSGFYINQVTPLFRSLSTPILGCQVANQHQVVVAHTGCSTKVLY